MCTSDVYQDAERERGFAICFLFMVLCCTGGRAASRTQWRPSGSSQLLQRHHTLPRVTRVTSRASTAVTGLMAV